MNLDEAKTIAGQPVSKEDPTEIEEAMLILLNRVGELEDAITYVVKQQLDDICWLDVYRGLAKLVGYVFDPLLMTREEFAKNCDRFFCSIQATTSYEPYFPYHGDLRLFAMKYERAAKALREAADLVQDVPGGLNR